MLPAPFVRLEIALRKVRHMRFLSLILSFVLIAQLAFAEDAQTNVPDSLENQIQTSIANWDSSSFSTRNSATRQLREVGAAAFPALTELAKRGGGEPLLRAFDLLKSSLNSHDAEVKAAARKSLDEIALSSNVRAARSAQRILREHDRPPQVASNQPFRMAPPQIQMQFGLAPMGVNPANGVRRISTRIVNGATTVEVTEPGSKIKIQSDQTGKIKMEVTKPKLGVDVTEKFEAANAAELKTKHPEAHQIYQKYERNLQGIGQRVGGIFTPPGFPAPNPNLPGGAGDPRQRILQFYDAQIESMKKVIAQQQNPALAESLNRNLQRITETRDRLHRELNGNR
jgi:hypothetical protein